MNNKLDSFAIRSKVTDEELWATYFGITNINKVKKNPLRDEKDNSFKTKVITYKGQRVIKWSDFGTDETWEDIFTALSKRYGWNTYESCVQINKDFNLGLSVSDKYNPDYVMMQPIRDVPVLEYTEESILEVVLNKHNDIPIMTKEDLKYWNKGYITKNILGKRKIFSVAIVLLNGNPIWYYRKDNPIFLYLETNTLGIGYKIYRPLEKDKTRKWLSNIKNDEITLYGDCKELSDDYLIITKSKKDFICLYDVLGYNAKYVQSEHFVFTDTLINDIWNKGYKAVYILYDNDNTGIKRMEEISRIADFIPIPFDTNLNVKDTWDCVLRYGIEESRNIINKLIK